MIQSAARAAVVAETARDELPRCPWEATLLETLDAQRERLGLLLDKKVFRLDGAVRALKVWVGLEVKDGRYGILYRMGFPSPLPKDMLLASRARASSFFAKTSAETDRKTKARGRTHSKPPPTFERVSATQLRDVAALAELGVVTLDSNALTFRTFNLGADPKPIVDTLLRTASELSFVVEHPYRTEAHTIESKELPESAVAATDGTGQ